MTAAQQSWGIVGGGMLGLTLAHRLAQRGERVTLFEAADRLGGLAEPWTLGDVVWDRHYHVTLLSDRHLRSLLAELGLEGEMEWRETRTGCYAGGRLYSVSNTWELLRFPVLGLLDKLRLGATIFYASKIRDGRRLERLPVAEWLTRWSGRRTFERFWLPLLRSKLGDNYRHTSAAFIWAVIARLYAARRTGLKKEMFGYVHGGYARILRRFGRTVAGEGVEVRLGQPVERVERGSGEMRLLMKDGEPETFDRIVLTVPAPLVSHLCPDLGDGERRRLEAIRYQGIVCASALLKRPLSDYYVTYILDDGAPFTGVIDMSALVERRHFGGNSLVYLPRYVSSDDAFFERADGEVAREFVGALQGMYPAFRPEDVLCFRVSRVRYVLALSTLDYSETVPPIHTSVPGLYLVSSAQIVNGTLNVNETVQLAEGAVRQLLA